MKRRKNGKAAPEGWKSPDGGKRMKAVLAVSFGTTVDETREKTIGAVERELAEAFPEHQLFRAFTSQKIVKALKKTGKGSFCTVWEALDEIAERGADELTVQPTFLTAGGEYGRLRSTLSEWLLAHPSVCKKAYLGKPLLDTAEDRIQAVRAVREELPALHNGEICLLAGHGTVGASNDEREGSGSGREDPASGAEKKMENLSDAMEALACEMSRGAMHFATLEEAERDFETVIRRLKVSPGAHILLVPFMLSAGHHILRDIGGEGENTWKSRLKERGFQVSLLERGLGEYRGIREIYVSHARRAESFKAEALR